MRVFFKSHQITIFAKMAIHTIHSHSHPLTIPLSNETRCNDAISSDVFYPPFIDHGSLLFHAQ